MWFNNFGKCNSVLLQTSNARQKITGCTESLLAYDITVYLLPQQQRLFEDPTLPAISGWVLNCDLPGKHSQLSSQSQSKSFNNNATRQFNTWLKAKGYLWIDKDRSSINRYLLKISYLRVSFEVYGLGFRECGVSSKWKGVRNFTYHVRIMSPESLLDCKLLVKYLLEQHYLINKVYVHVSFIFQFLPPWQ